VSYGKKSKSLTVAGCIHGSDSDSSGDGEEEDEGKLKELVSQQVQ
jgi:hypothetical protein